MHVGKRAARVAGRKPDVGPNKTIAARAVRPECDPGGQHVRDAQRVTERDEQFADAQVGRTTNLDRLKLRGIDRDGGKIACIVTPYDGTAHLPAVGKLDRYRSCARNVARWSRSFRPATKRLRCPSRDRARSAR